jgi:small-conductance mechanosensitive channel
MVALGGEQLVVETLRAIANGLLEALPAVVSALILLLVAYVGIAIATFLLHRAFSRMYPADRGLVVDLYITIVRVFLWFLTALALLSVLGLERIAASLGTASGFVALGIAYALSDMIEDTVAGVYLLRDPDFEVGDQIVVGSVEGELVAIDLRKSRVDLSSGDRVVLRNRDVEDRWTKRPA